MMKRVYEYVKDEEFRFTIFSDRLHVINYKKIISLQSEDVSFIGDGKRISIKGKNLVLNKLLDDEILILGDIIKVEVFDV